MVPTFSRSIPLLTVVSLATFLAACATTPKGQEGGVFENSTLDFTNRAPSSMSIPSDTEGSPVIDSLHLRTQADYHFSMAEAYSLEGNSARAVEEYKLTLVYDQKSTEVRLRLAAEYVKQGLVSEAVEQAKTALETDPKNEDAHMLLGGLYSAMRMYDDAFAQYQKVIDNDATNLEAPMFIGALLAEQKKYAEATIRFEKLAKNPDNPNAHLAWYYLGRVRLEESSGKNTARAEAAFRESLAAKPSYAEAVLALGQIYESAGHKEQTIQLYKNFQEKSGPSSSVAEELSRLFIEQKDYASAYEQFAIIESNDPSDLNVKAKMAFILIEQQKYPEAIVRLEDVLMREPSSDKVRFYLGAVYEEVKDYKAAISHFDKVPVASSYYKESVVHVAYLYKLLGDYDKAIAAVESGIKAQDDNPPFYALYASLLDDTKQYAKAVKMLTAAVDKFPDHAQLRFFLGNMQDRVGDKKAMIESMKKTLELDKDHVQALNFLAFSYAEMGQNLDDAERMVRRALELQPNDGYILDTFGWVLFKQGKTAEAVRTLEAAYQKQPDESVIAEHLGDAYYQNQMPEKAKRLYQRAVETEANATEIQKIRAKIVSVDRQIQSLGPDSDGNVRQPASAQTPAAEQTK